MSQIGSLSGGAQGAPLANLFVQFSQQGMQQLIDAILALEKELQALTDLVGDFSAQLQISIDASITGLSNLDAIIKALETEFQKLADIASNALKSITAAITGLITVGVHLSALGQQLAFVFQQLALTIAGLFAPEIQKIIDLIQRLTNWINNLTDAQRANLARWAEAIAAASTVLILFPRLISTIQLVTSAVKALTAAIAVGLSSSGIGALLPLISLLVAALTALFVGTEQGRNALVKLWEAFKPLIDVLGELLSEIGGVITEIFAALAEAIAALLELLKPLIEFFAFLAKIILQGILAPFYLVAKGITAIKDALKDLFGIEDKKKETDNRNKLAGALGGTGDLAGILQQINEKSRLVGFGRSVEEEQLDELRQIRLNTAKTNDTLDSANPILNKGI